MAYFTAWASPERSGSSACRGEFATALLTFNAGVEAGQLAVIGTAFVLVGGHCANRAWYRRRVVVPASLLIACTSVYWTIERLIS